MNIIGLFPLTGNGGIASWTKKYMATFPDDEFHFKYINVSSTTNIKAKGNISRLLIGLYGMTKVLWNVRRAMKKGHFDILHTTTSGNIGHIRDYYVARMCRRNGVKSIMHCRYGCIPDDIKSSGIVGKYLKKALSEFDQTWVLDKKSYIAINNIDEYKGKVFLTPNSIDVREKLDSAPKQYNTIAFCGNVYPTKGVLELVKGAIQTDIVLHIIGPATGEMVKEIENIAGDLIGDRVITHGRLPNAEAVDFLKNVDMIALPTYYKSEAFPISIIEAMSLSKLVISCDRAAISDMRTALDGTMCGILVKPKSSDAIRDAILWCQSHKEEADKMRIKAYEKVYSSYRKEVVYELYRTHYRNLYNS